MRSDSSNVTEEIGKTGEARKQSQGTACFLSPIVPTSDGKGMSMMSPCVRAKGFFIGDFRFD